MRRVREMLRLTLDAGLSVAETARRMGLARSTVREMAVRFGRSELSWPLPLDLTDADLEKITSTYHAWRGDKGVGKYQDVPGFCKSATTVEIAAHGHVLTPGRYVGAHQVEGDGEPFEEKMPRLVAELHTQFAQSAKLEQAIKTNLLKLGFI